MKRILFLSLTIILVVALLTPYSQAACDISKIPADFQFTQNLQKGSQGTEVKYLQLVLQCIVGEDVVGAADGIFGTKTETAVKKYQSMRGLVSDGIVGPNTRAKLNADLAALRGAPIDNKPTVNAFNVTPNSLTLGNSFTISYTVSDDTGLKQTELWRANDNNGNPVGWAEIKRTPLSSQKSYPGSFTDAPSSTGAYWYGLHVVDNAGNWNDENNSQTGGKPGVYGPIKVTVTEKKPAPPTLVSPSNNSTVNTATPTFKWNSVANADYYALFISKPPYGESNLVFNSKVNYGPIYGTSFTLPSGILSNGVTYRWNMSSYNSAGWSDGYSDAWDFTVQINLPPTVVSTSPAKDDMAAPVTDTITATFSENIQAGTMSVQVMDEKKNSVPIKKITVSGKTLTISLTVTLAHETIYGVGIDQGAVKSLAGVPNTKYSWAFRTAAPESPPAPILISPANGATDVSITPTLSWHSVDRATGYIVQVSKNSDFTDKVFDQAIANTSVQVSLAYNTHYFWRVLAAIGLTLSSWSEVWTFTTTPQKFNLTININGQGTTNPIQGTHTYDEGTQVTVTANPVSGWEFDHWSGDASGSSNPINITMNNNKSITAHFEKEQMPPATVKVLLQKDPITVGESTIIDVKIEQATNFGGFEFKLRYNPSIIEITTGDVQIGNFLPQDKFHPLGPNIKPAGNLNELVYGASLLGSASGQTGSGSLAHITVKGVGAGATSLELKDVLIIDSTSTSQPVNTTDSTITVKDTKLPTLTITQPYNGQNFTTPNITVKGTASDESGIWKVTVNGEVASGTTSWSKDITLSQGSNTITVIAYDDSPNHNSTTKTITVTYIPQAVTIKAIDTSGSTGTVVSIPINIDDVTGLDIISSQFTLSYDANVLKAKEATATGTLSQAWGPSTYNITNGQIIIWMAGTTALSGSGTLAKINFEVNEKAKPGDTSSLTLSGVKFNEGAVSVTTQNGVFTVEGRYGDVSLDGSISAYDAALILRHGVGLIVLASSQQTMADVSGDGTVSAYDAALILRYGVGLIAKFPAEEKPPASPQLPFVRVADYGIKLDNNLYKPGTIFTASIQIENASGILASEIVLMYDQNLLMPVEIKADSGHLIQHKADNGQLNIWLAGTEIFEGNGSLVSITFKVSENVAASFKSHLNLSKFKLNETAFQNKQTEITIQPYQFRLLQNYPNPFNPETWIPYELSKPEQVIIKIYNNSGRIVRILNLGHKQAGLYLDKNQAAYWDGRNKDGERIASGIYFYQIQAGKQQIATKKMVVLK